MKKHAIAGIICGVISLILAIGLGGVTITGLVFFVVAFAVLFGGYTFFAKKKTRSFFAAKATCAICGKEVGMNRFKIGDTIDGNTVWKCPECAKKSGYVKWDKVTGKAELITEQETETRMKCNTCGQVYCYTMADLERNKALAKSAAIDSVIGVGEALGGTRLASYVAGAKADSKLNQMVDYTKCPHCHSSDAQVFSKEEWEIDQKKRNNDDSVISSADELKMFKELLDIGVITQEEFDAKKKQLLGL
jgi:Zn finger protein HypA/HybF involved in hydrogenase expression